MAAQKSRALALGPISNRQIDPSLTCLMGAILTSAADALWVYAHNLTVGLVPGRFRGTQAPPRRRVRGRLPTARATRGREGPTKQAVRLYVQGTVGGMKNDARRRALT